MVVGTHNIALEQLSQMAVYQQSVCRLKPELGSNDIFSRLFSAYLNFASLETVHEKGGMIVSAKRMQQCFLASSSFCDRRRITIKIAKDSRVILSSWLIAGFRSLTIQRLTGSAHNTPDKHNTVSCNLSSLFTIWGIQGIFTETTACAKC